MSLQPYWGWVPAIRENLRPPSRSWSAVQPVKMLAPERWDMGRPLGRGSDIPHMFSMYADDEAVRWPSKNAALHCAGLPPQLVCTFEPAAPPTPIPRMASSAIALLLKSMKTYGNGNPRSPHHLDCCQRYSLRVECSLGGRRPL